MNPTVPITPVFSDAAFALCLALLLVAPLAIAGVALINTGLGRCRSAAQALLGNLVILAVAAISFALIGATWAGSAGAAGHCFQLAGKNWEMQKTQRLMQDEIISGVDELGVLLMGHARGAYWYGSQLSIEDARALCPHNNATSLQVTAAVLGGVIWAMSTSPR